MNLCYNNDVIKLKMHNKVFIDNYKSYYTFLKIIYSKSSTINGDIIIKNFKIYNFCDYEFYKNVKQFKKNTLLNDYLLLKIRSIDENEKNKLSGKIFDVIEMLNIELGINSNSLTDDLNNLFYNLLLEQDINIEELSIDEMINFIITNTNDNYLIIYDSSLIKLSERKNVILFDINSHLDTYDYNVICCFNTLKNLNVDLVIENMHRYWPIPIEKVKLECEINNKFLKIMSLDKICTYDKNSIIFAKLINYFYQRNIDIKYYGNDNTIKSFLSSNLNY